MRRYLVVANKTLGGARLKRHLEGCVAKGPCQVHVLVPATIDPTSTGMHDAARDHRLARRRLEQALERFGALGVEVTGEIGDHRPIDAIYDVLRREAFDEIIVSTLPPGASRWLRRDLISRLQRSVAIPTTHIVADDAEVAAR